MISPFPWRRQQGVVPRCGASATWGGWKDPTTVVKCYQRPSEDAMRAAQASRRALDG